MKKISMDNFGPASEGAHIIDENVARMLERKNISPSMITGLEPCPARWLADNYVMRDIIEPDPDSPALRGSLFHEVMERFFELPPEKRNKNKLKTIMNETINKPDFVEMKSSPETIQWLKTAVSNYYKMGAQPQKVKVATVEIDGREKEGLEIFVKGKLGDTKRDILGVVDRVIVDNKDPKKVIIEDWKTGATVRKWKNNTKSDDGLPEQRQQIIYTKLMEQKGVEVSGARLIYPVAEEIVDVQLGNKVLETRIIEDIVQTDRELSMMEENNTFEYRPSFLCSWCSIVKLCPVAQLNMRSEKMKSAYESQPDPDLLLEHIELLDAPPTDFLPTEDVSDGLF